MTVKFTNVGGDPFSDESTLADFINALLEAGADRVLLGDEEWPDVEGIHDRPVIAEGIELDEAEAVWADFQDDAVAIGAPKQHPEGGNPGGNGPETGKQVPDNARSVSSRDEIGENERAVEGPRGGLYAVNTGEEKDPSDMSDEELEEALRNIVGEDAAQGFVDSGDRVTAEDILRDELPEDWGEDTSSDDEAVDDETESSELDLDNSVSQMSLREAGVQEGKTAEHMEVHELEDGSNAYVKNFGDDEIEPERKDNIEAGYQVMQQLAPDQVPEMAFEDDQVIAAEAEGVDGWEADDVNEDEYIQGAAAQVLMGNNDARAENVLVDEDGTPKFFDFDDAATEGAVEESIRRAASTFGSITGESKADAAEAIGEAVKDMRDDVDTSELDGEQADIVQGIVDADDSEIDEAVEEAKVHF